MTEWYKAIRTVRLHGRWTIMGVMTGVVIALLIFAIQPRQWRAEMILAPTHRTVLPMNNTSYYNNIVAADAPSLYKPSYMTSADQSSDFTIFQAMIISPDSINQLYQSSKNLHQFEQKDDLYIYLQNRIQIRPKGQTNLIRITFVHHDPVEASQILRRLYDITDQKIRENAKQTVEARITHLNAQLLKTMNPNHRDALLALLRDQERTLMMAKIDQAFAAKLVSAPFTYPKPASPNIGILFPVFGFSGGLIGFIASGFSRANRAFKLRNIVRPPKKKASNINNPDDKLAQKIVNR